MKNGGKIGLFVFLPCLSAGIFVLAGLAIAAGNSVTISAVQTHGQKAADDFIELHNPTCADINLSGWKLRLRNGGEKASESSIKVIDKGKTIPAQGYFLWTHSGLAETLDADQTTGASLSDDYSIGLFNNQGDLLDSMTWGDNRNPFDAAIAAPNPEDSYAIIRNADGTISAEKNYQPKNSSVIDENGLSVCPQEEKEKEEENIEDATGDPSPPSIHISEIFPAPAEKDQPEFIELYNPAKNLDLSGWLLRDASKTGKYAFPEGAHIPEQTYLAIYEKDFKFALNNSGSETVTLFSPDGQSVSTLSYSGSKKGASYNFDGKNWRWSKFLTPGAANIFNNPPETKTDVPKKVYVDTYADFSAKGSDRDGEKLKYTWDFGDGHKSYLQKTRHKYEKTGQYAVKLKVADGSEDKIETFKVTVEKFPKLSVKITGLLPNPAGADTGNEYLEIKNGTKKKINLRNWSVGSGAEKLTNHPIAEDFFIKPGKTARITYAISKFTLPNTRGKVELRYPNGKTASHASYGDKKKSVAEGATYEKTKSGWQWNLLIAKTAAIGKPASTTEITAAILPQENISAQIESDPIVEEKNLGRSTRSPAWQSKKETRFSLLNFGLRIKTAQAFSEENRPLPKNYFSARNFPAQKHWLIALLENLNGKMNYFLNKLF